MDLCREADMPHDLAPLLPVALRRQPRLQMLPIYVFPGFHGHLTTVTELLSTREVTVTFFIIYNGLLTFEKSLLYFEHNLQEKARL